MDILGNLNTLQATLAALATIAGAVFGFLRWVRPKYKAVGRDFRAGRDALVGRDEIRDSITGAVLVPALPGMGVRMDTQEKQLSTLTEAVSTLAKTTVQLADHEQRIKILEAAAVERVVTKVESAQAWRAVEAIASQAAVDEALPGVGEN